MQVFRIFKIIISVTFFLFFLSCDNDNSLSPCNIEHEEEILGSLEWKQDTTTEIVNRLNASGYYTKAKEYSGKQKWDEFTNYYLPNVSVPNDLRGVDVYGEIDEILGSADIVMLNETHELPHHRVFAHSLLPYLKQNGFKTIACEALTTEKDYLTDGFLNQNSSVYTKEPFYVNFLTSALMKGFQLIAYEPKENYNIRKRGLRDSLMCNNILKKWDPTKGKLFIYCGWGHLNDNQYTLKRYLQNQLPSCNIVTINQVWLNLEHPSGVQNEVREQVGMITKPTILKGKEGYFALRDHYDIEVIHPKYQKNYSDISKVYGMYKKIELNFLRNKGFNSAILYQAGITLNNCDFVPSAVIPDLKSKTFVNIPNGVYNIYLFNNEKMVFAKKIKVE